MSDAQTDCPVEWSYSSATDGSKPQSVAKRYKWKSKNKDFDVEETRKLAAAHGKDGLIIISWIDNGDGTVKYNTTTAGKKRNYALAAAALRDYLMSFIGGNDGKPIRVEDRLNEHTE